MTPHPLITEDERRAYGDEALSVMERKAREVVGPVVNDLNRQNQQLRSELQRVKAHDIYSTLDQNMPNWREINTSQEFLDWLRVPDPCSGAAKSALLRAAFDSGDAGRVLAIFNGSLPSTRSSRPHAPRERPRTIRDQLSLPRTLTASMRTADAAFTTAKRSRRWPRKLKFMPLSCRGD